MDRSQARRLMQTLRRDGLVELSGVTKGSRWHL